MRNSRSNGSVDSTVDTASSPNSTMKFVDSERNQHVGMFENDINNENQSSTRKPGSNEIKSPKERSTEPSSQHDQTQQGDDGHYASDVAVTATPKPFFIMDWLEQIDSHHLELAQKMLKTPQKTPHTSRSCNGSGGSAASVDTHLVGEGTQLPHQLFTAPTGCSGTSLPSISTESARASKMDIPIPQNLPQPIASTPLRHHQEKQLQQPGGEPSSASSSRKTSNCWRKRSIAMGNGWNAKGLHKAKAGRWQDARRCWENALEIRSQVLGEDHLDVANTCNNLGIALGKLNEFDDAVGVLQRALDIRTQHLGREHEEVAATIHNLGNVMQQSGDIVSAVECFWESKRLQEHILGPDHIQVARACVSIGSAYYQSVEEYHDQAYAAYWEALAIFDRAGLPKDNVEVQYVLAQVHELTRFLSQGKGTM